LLVVLVGLAAAAVGLEMVLLHNLGRRPEPAAVVQRPDPPAAPAPSGPPAAPVPQPPAGATPRLTVPEETRSIPATHLEALGGLAGVHLYQTHLNIGLLADAAENEVYTPAEAKGLLRIVAGLVDAVEKQIAEIPDAMLGAEDRAALKKVGELTALLRTQSRELQAYWDDGGKDHAEKFHKARAETWGQLKELLKIEEIAR
jgi:hypothetical protein